MKTMLLVCDKIGLSLNTELVDDVIERDPVLAVPLSERGLLVNFDPREELSQASSTRLAEALTEVIEHLPRWTGRDRSPLIMEHWGAAAAPRAAARFQQALADRGLLSSASSIGMIEMDEKARALVLIAFATVLRHDLAARVALHPVAPDYGQPWSGFSETVLSYLRELGDRENKNAPLGSEDFTDSVILLDDLMAIDVDLSAVPLDEILAFRRENRAHYRAYINGVRGTLERALGRATWNSA